MSGHFPGHARLIGIGISMLALFGCDSRTPEPSTTALQAPLGGDRLISFESVNRGFRLYQEHCAQCHGPEAQGHPDWENPKLAAAPPLDGSGNEWMRKRVELIAAIKNGAKRGDELVMPGWADRLTEQETEDIVNWFQALWPLDVYERWLKIENGQPVDVNAADGDTKTGNKKRQP